jgi:hypothetical protein
MTLDELVKKYSERLSSEAVPCDCGIWPVILVDNAELKDSKDIEILIRQACLEYARSVLPEKLNENTGDRDYDESHRSKNFVRQEILDRINSDSK